MFTNRATAPSFSSHSISAPPTSFSWTNKASRSPLSRCWFAPAPSGPLPRSVPASNATAVGQGSSATALGATSLGQASVASGSGATALGTGSSAGFANSAAIGSGVTTTRVNQVALGTATNTYTLAGVTSAASLAAQTGPTKVLTTDALGNLAAARLTPH